MPEYTAPLRDMRFVLHELLNVDEHYQKLGLEEVNAELIDAFLEEGSRFATNELAPLNRSGDEEGCKFDNGTVTRSEEHTSELQSRFDLVCRLLLEKKKRTLSRKMSTS